MAHIYISIGSNIEPLRHIRAGLIDLQRIFAIDKHNLIVSSVYESQAVGFTGDNFYNLVVAFDTQEAVHTINQQLRLIEQANGRQRSQNRFASRTLDLDLLLYDDLIVQEQGLELPRSEIVKYAFVLLPLAEIAPQDKHPVNGQSYNKLWQAFDKSSQPLWRVNVDVL